MLILGSCLALNLSYSGCCVWSMSPPPCSNKGCYCDQSCHNHNDCCSDIADIGCHPASSSSTIVLTTTTETLSKTKLVAHLIHYSHNFLNKLTLINKKIEILVDFLISCVY